MNKPSSETQDELRKKQSINEESEFEINKLKVECFSYLENIELTKDVNDNLSKEIEDKRITLQKFENQFDSIGNDSTIKANAVKKSVQEFIQKNIPVM